MLFTRTIRRKLLLGAGLVLGMLLILSASGIWALITNRAVVDDVTFDLTQAPHPAGLVAAAIELFDLIDRWPSRSDADTAFQQTQLGALIDKARHESDQFRRRSEKLPPGPVWMGQRLVTVKLIEGYGESLARLDQLNDELADSATRKATLKKMKKEARLMRSFAKQIPDPVEDVESKLVLARRVYSSALTAMAAASAVVVILFLGWLQSGYVWIFDPIRKLHQGARRVAQGDFSYRVNLKTRDEMAELADAFNKMTGRFQEIAANLDSQVQERSRQLVQSERLAGVGFLAAGVAHEINNPLSAIAMASESLEGRILEHIAALDPAEAQVVRQYLQLIQTESFRCREITERLLDFARGRDAVREPNDVAQLVAEVVAMVQHLSKYREKKIEYAPPGPCVAEVNGPEIKQVILNLVANGLDAVERGGTLKITVQQQTDEVVLEFVDDGCGMTVEVIENLFEPFFTRKTVGQGTGLGLSISHRIVSQHGGTISPASAGPGRGSRFVVRLPRQARADRAAA
ncbi:MAG: HAMP domain-containing histidine kinase [Planctomycetia bacterium]|nr:HAMP domain-containing histidine kinase [Planctomycetia bacterium]